MTERPILFSAEMVRAILAGKKTQTRRCVKPQPGPECDKFEKGLLNDAWQSGFIDVRCPYGQPGDRLWVKEAFQWLHFTTDDETGICDGCIYPTAKPTPDDIEKFYHPVYRADGVFEESKIDRGFPWKPSLFMPRCASRILLEITAVRCERLQDITREDASAEGVVSFDELSTVDRFSILWESINGKTPGKRWEDNPWVWVIEFKQVRNEL